MTQHEDTGKLHPGHALSKPRRKIIAHREKAGYSEGEYHHEERAGHIEKFFVIFVYFVVDKNYNISMGLALSAYSESTFLEEVSLPA